MLKNSPSYTRYLFTTIASGKTKVFKLLLKISGLRPVKLIRTDLWTPKKDLLFSTLLMQSIQKASLYVFPPEKLAWSFL